MNAHAAQLESPALVDPAAPDDAERADYARRLIAHRCPELADAGLADADLRFTVGAGAMSNVTFHAADAESLNLDFTDEVRSLPPDDVVPMEIVVRILDVVDAFHQRLAELEERAA